MKKLFLLILPATLLLWSCGGNKKTEAPATTDVQKKNAVSVTEMQPIAFDAHIEVQAQVTGDENVLATTQAPGTVKAVLVHAGQKVSKGQVLAVIDANMVDQQIATLAPQLALTKALFEKQQALWQQNVGSEVQLLSAKTNYESVQQQIAALKSQRDMYRIVSPISGTVDNVGIKVGDVASPGMGGIRVVSYDKLKVEAILGENYLGKVKTGDKATIEFPDLGDTINTHLTYVAQSVDVMSRGFSVQIQLPNATKIHPNMACILKIANYTNPAALIVPVSVIQKTATGERLFIYAGGIAKEIAVTTGRISNGNAEIVSGLNAGDKVITVGYEELENGQKVELQ
ncbi:MAG: efflux RND transporter periplasmic adaptor subunit [Chitinophagia bacterium]|nr:efflux RND transporter periplasmic adaptor subunit [Chitinophagia bacterium]